MDLSHSVRRSLSLLLTLLLLMQPLSPAWAQSDVDVEPPLLEVDPVLQSPAEQKQVFTAKVSDDREIDEVALFVRRAGEAEYRKIPMRALGGSGFYSVTIDTDPADLRPIEHYFRAMDKAGNQTVRGFAFDPFRRNLTPRESPLATTAPPAPEPAAESRGSSRKWWAAALGVLVVGAIAAAASDSGGSGGGNNDGTVPLSITIEEP